MPETYLHPLSSSLSSPSTSSQSSSPSSNSPILFTLPLTVRLDAPGRETSSQQIGIIVTQVQHSQGKGLHVELNQEVKRSKEYRQRNSFDE